MIPLMYSQLSKPILLHAEICSSLILHQKQKDNIQSTIYNFHWSNQNIVYTLSQHKGKQRQKAYIK